MSYVITPTFGAAKIAVAVVTNIVNLPGAGALSYIHLTGATFITGGTTSGDGATITGSGAGNNGTHLIVDVPDEEVLIVRANLAAEAGVASVAVVIGVHVLTITDEITTDWATITAAVAERAYVHQHLMKGSDRGINYFIYAHTLADIIIQSVSPGNVTVWTSQNEAVYGRVQDTTAWTISNVSGANVVDVTLNLGVLSTPSDRRSFSAGSIWMACRSALVDGTFFSNIYGTTWHMLSSTTPCFFSTDGELFGCLIVGNFEIKDGTQVSGYEFSDLIFYGITDTHQPPVLEDTIAFSNNFVVGDVINAAFMTFTSSPIVLEDWGLSGGAPSPLYRLNTIDATLRNLKTDVPITDILTIWLSPLVTFGHKTYTFNPIVADWRGNPLSGALVSISQIDDATPLSETPISGSPFTTDVNGQINTGSGVQLETQFLTGSPRPGIITDYSYRVKIEAAGFKVWDNVIKPTQPDTAEVGLKSIEASFEGEEALS